MAGMLPAPISWIGTYKKDQHFDMARKWFPWRLSFLPLMLLAVALAFGQPAADTIDDPLPDAPSVVHSSEPGKVPASKWFGVVDPGEKVPPLYTRDKLEFWLHEEFEPLGLFPAFATSGWEQLMNSDPKYGSDSGAYGQRLGAAVVREASMRLFSDSLLPAITHEDPRYFRKAYGTVTQRGVYAAKRVFVAQRDDGSHGFNYSDVVGRAAASALTMAYYPHESANWGVAARTWGVSLAGLAGNNLFFEFWPDVRDKLFHRHEKDADY
jgi:hypothetical protein